MKQQLRVRCKKKALRFMVMELMVKKHKLIKSSKTIVT